LKLDNLLAPYLYQYKKLNLPGIGTFEADISTVVPEDNDKHQAPVQGITFIQSSSPEPDSELIEFIKAHTGKMKPLAIADLESYLMLLKQFVNIGKPFYIEGIGTLQKITDGTLKFTPGEYITTRLENGMQELTTGTKRKAYTENKNTGTEAGKSASRKAMLIIATIATVAAIGWGGYYLYKMNANKEKQEETPVNTINPMPDTSQATIIQPDSSMFVKDTLTVVTKADPMAIQPVRVTATAGNYKFIFETTSNKNRAIYRYNYLNKFNPRIQLQTKADSSLFKIYVVLPATSADTARLKDSLNAWYYGKKEMRVRIEQ
jgi:hypothetical protein